MTLYAVGAPGERIRLYVDTDRPESASLQPRPGEVVMVIAAQPSVPASIVETSEGYALAREADPQPESEDDPWSLAAYRRAVSQLAEA